MRNHSYENVFYLHEKEKVCRTHFHMKGFPLRLVLKQRHVRTRKWPIPFLILSFMNFVVSVVSTLILPLNQIKCRISSTNVASHAEVVMQSVVGHSSSCERRRTGLNFAERTRRDAVLVV